jgi:hypothetical protein
VIRLVQAHGALGQLFFDTGRWTDALTEVEALHEDLKEPMAACCDLGIAAVICFHRGEIAAARRHLAAAVPQAEVTSHNSGIGNTTPVRPWPTAFGSRAIGHYRK